MIGRVSDLLEVSKEQKKSVEGQLEQKHREVAKLETSYKSLSKEFTKVREFLSSTFFPVYIYVCAHVRVCICVYM